MIHRLCLLILIFSFVFLLGCASKDMYYWGDYEKSVYRMYRSDEFSPSKEIALLKKQIEKARRSNKAVGPGINAHLGYLYSLEGDRVAAVDSFRAEKEAFPVHADIKTTLGYYTTMRDEDMERGKQPFSASTITPKT